MSRTKNTINNIMWAFTGQAVGLVISFISRMIFIRTLGAEYLGLNGLFSNILTVLSLAELGVGTAIIYSLYKPLAEKDKEKLKMLMSLYQKVYRVIGIVIFSLGILLTPFLNIFIKELPDIKNISIIYILFVVNTSVSYFYSYKRNLIIADQNRYIATIYRYSCYIIMNIMQIIYLLLTKEYFGYLILQILFTIIENLLVSRKADKMYEFLNEKDVPKLDECTKKEIIKNTKAMMMHRIGGTVVNSTDNILLSSFVGLEAVGKYSNYLLIITALNTIVSQIYNSLTAGIGNLCAEEDKENAYNVFKKIDFLTFTISFFCSMFLIALFNDSIKLMAGNDYIFEIQIVLMIIINFYLTTMRKSVLSFREANGLFYKDRYKALCEAIINIVVSIILVRKIGTIGIFIGTFISSITTCVWVEPYVLYKYYFNKPLIWYFKDYFKYLIVTIVVGTIVYLICYFIDVNIILNIIIKALVTMLISSGIFIIIYKKKEEFQYFRNLLKSIVEKVIKSKIA